MPDKCKIDPERDCFGLIKANELERDLNDLRKQNASSHERIFERLNDLEKQEGIQGEQYKHILDKLGDVTTNLTELKADSREVVAKLPPLTQRVESLEQLSDQVEELKSKPAKRWENMAEQIIGIVVAAVIGFMLARLGL